MFLTAVCHPDHLWQSLFWQNCHFQVFWNLKRHQTNLSNGTEHSSCHSYIANLCQTAGWGDERKWEVGISAPLPTPGSSMASLEGSFLPFPWVWCCGRPNAAGFLQGYGYPDGRALACGMEWVCSALNISAKGQRKPQGPATLNFAQYPGTLGIFRETSLGVLWLGCQPVMLHNSGFALHLRHPCLSPNPESMGFTVPFSCKPGRQKAYAIFHWEASMFFILPVWNLIRNIQGKIRWMTGQVDGTVTLPPTVWRGTPLAFLFISGTWRMRPGGVPPTYDRGRLRYMLVSSLLKAHYVSWAFEISFLQSFLHEKKNRRNLYNYHTTFYINTFFIS